MFHYPMHWFNLLFSMRIDSIYSVHFMEFIHWEYGQLVFDDVPEHIHKFEKKILWNGHEIRMQCEWYEKNAKSQPDLSASCIYWNIWKIISIVTLSLRCNMIGIFQPTALLLNFFFLLCYCTYTNSITKLTQHKITLTKSIICSLTAVI